MKSKKLIKIGIIGILSAMLFVSLSGCSSSVGTGGKATVISDEKADSASKKESSKKEDADPVEKETSTAGSQEQVETTVSGGGGEQPETQPQPEAPAVTVTVIVDAGQYGGYLASQTLGYSYQPTALDVLYATGVSVDASGDYVSGINGLYEFDHGATSGWLYTVNGETPMVASGNYRLNNGDSVYWYYQAE